jgi:hypothetical protein
LIVKDVRVQVILVRPAEWRFDRPAGTSFSSKPDPAEDLDLRLERADGQQVGYGDVAVPFTLSGAPADPVDE